MQVAQKRILLVDDDGALREFLAHALRRAGYTVDVAATGAEAHRLLDSHVYGLVIADWQLPDGNGIDLADRANNLRAKTIVLSGYLVGLPAGAAKRHGLMTKPVSTYDLVTAVQRRIGNPS